MVYLATKPAGQPAWTSPTGGAQARPTGRSQGGFTLVELMVVMAIIGLVVTTVSLSMEAILPGERLNTSIRELAADLMQVRTEAISRSMEFRMEYDLDGDRYRIATPYRIGGGRIITTDDPMDEELRFYSPWTPMREGVALMSVYTGGESHEEGRVIVRFDALGSATDHLVIVSQPAYGNAFTIGNDHLTNIVMFGKDKFRLDLIGLWLAGHEPGNVNLYRIAKERGLSDTFNPWEVPIYEWIDGEAQPRKLTDFERTPLVTYYLQKDGEPEYPLVDEPFDYDKVKV